MLDIHKIYDSNNFGKFRVVKYSDCRNIEIEFIDTGYRLNAKAENIRSGCIKDKLKPTVYGVGFVGVGRHAPSINKKNTKPYCTWVNMFERCYSPKYHERRPNYKGCEVAQDWHNFQNFANWFECNYVDGFQLDKDKLVAGNKIYSAENCVFLSNHENTEISVSKCYRFINPQGCAVSIYNLNKFCRENNLNRSCMGFVHSGTQNSHKQWRAA